MPRVPRHAARIVFACTLAAQLAHAQGQQQQPGPPNPSVYDPLRGMDPDGRIPKPAVPADIAHPERWRYTPPARIKPGSVFDRFLVSSFVSPLSTASMLE